jgi:hypothetical protein
LEDATNVAQRKRGFWNLPVRCVAIIGIACATVTVASPEDALLSRASAINPGLHSYQANIHADISMKTFPYLSPMLDGIYYHKEPGMDKIVFTSGLPGMAQEFSKVYPHIESPAGWNRVYVITFVANDGRTTTYKLVPRKHGRVDRIDTSIDDATATVLSMRWNYNDGGYAELHQTYSIVNGNYLVTGQTGHFETSLYKADVTSSFTNYTLNPSIPDTFFKQDE